MMTQLMLERAALARKVFSRTPHPGMDEIDPGYFAQNEEDSIGFLVNNLGEYQAFSIGGGTDYYFRLLVRSVSE